MSKEKIVVPSDKKEVSKKVAVELEVENPKTKVKSKVVLSGLQSFFVSPSHMTT